MQKLENWRVQICRCTRTRQDLKVIPWVYPSLCLAILSNTINNDFLGIIQNFKKNLFFFPLPFPFASIQKIQSILVFWPYYCGYEIFLDSKYCESLL